MEHDIIKDIKELINQPVPSIDERYLSNPFKKNKQTKSRNSSNKQTSNELVDYFCKKYSIIFSKAYKKTLRSDQMAVNSAKSFFELNHLDADKTYKQFIDFSCKNKDLIIKKYKYFTISSINNLLNEFIQYLMSSKDTSIEYNDDIDFYDDLSIMIKNFSVRDCLVKYGIPLVATYLTKHKNLDSITIKKSILKLLNDIQNNDPQGKSKIEIIFKKSILLSPYPKDFEGLDWRNEFNNFVDYYKNEKWFRNNDYKGAINNSYLKFKNGST